MADEDRTFSPSTVSANRTQMQGGGVGQKEMNLQRSPNRAQTATEEDRTEGWDNDPAGADAAAPASGASDAEDDELEERSFDPADEAPKSPRFGDGTPASLDPSNIGERDDPELDWGEAEPGAVFGSNHTRRGVKTEAERGQGRRTRARTKEIINRQV
ncbi:MAG: hypothetical protein WCY15_13585 [Phenylobacterium sp.]|jgi:hypothetical protein|uniref:hypothetical protein n=1 Tax=Phenylobacterium sp. TaxID=1871053 RepID=UPI002A36DA55|nr:hypothetical protein [Phenylobacterium sp.]MDX9996548.1 hypothetical protein [Phenylobacterium sp.]